MIRGGTLGSRRLYSLFHSVAVCQRKNIEEEVTSATVHELCYAGKGYGNSLPCHEQLACRDV
jgi:hypothetical protein